MALRETPFARYSLRRRHHAANTRSGCHAHPQAEGGDRGENALMFTSFPSSFCTDSGRAINISGEPPINEPTDAKVHEPVWLATLPKGVLTIYAYWKDNLQSGGFGFSARMINYPGGMPGDVGLFFSWPRAAVEK
jgi:hypothetical protein